MFTLKSKLSALLAALLCAGTALAQDSGPLIDILVKKGLINDQEAEELRADLVKDFAATSAGKLNLSTPLTEFKISGDVRVRFEDRAAKIAVTDDHLERNRLRYRFRTSLAGKLLNNWAFGVRLETATGSRSSNVTMGDDGGPFAKTNDLVNVGQIFMQWTPTPEWTFTAGRMANPLVSTSMVWDADINPEGLAEQYKHREGQNEYGVTLGQFLYSTSGNQNTTAVTAAAPAGAKDLYLTAWQGYYKRYIEGTGTFFQVAPTMYAYYNTDQRKNPAAFNSFMVAGNPAPINNLLVLDVPFEYDWVAANGVPLRAFADVAINFDADQRAAKFGRPDLNGQDKAYHVGLQYGKATLPGEWDAKIFYQSAGAFALDTNLVDSDLFDSRTNMQGFVLAGNYALGAATQLSLTLAQGQRVNDSVIAPGAGDVGSNNAIDKYWVFQCDLNIKF